MKALCLIDLNGFFAIACGWTGLVRGLDIFAFGGSSLGSVVQVFLVLLLHL
jgi:hypothetical protein